MYDLTKLIDRLKRVRYNPPDWAVDEGHTVSAPPRGAFKGTDLLPWDMQIFVELGDGNGSQSAALESVRFERHNGGICVVLSSLPFPGHEAAE